MGTYYNFICKTCKHSVCLGYGPYGTWLIDAKDLSEYESLTDRNKELRKNINFRQNMIIHSGHDFIVVGGDYTSVRDGDLLEMAGYGWDVIIAGFSEEYTFFSYSDDGKLLCRSH